MTDDEVKQAGYKPSESYWLMIRAASLSSGFFLLPIGMKRQSGDLMLQNQTWILWNGNNGLPEVEAGSALTVRCRCVYAESSKSICPHTPKGA